MGEAAHMRGFHFLRKRDPPQKWVLGVGAAGAKAQEGGRVERVRHRSDAPCGGAEERRGGC